MPCTVVCIAAVTVHPHGRGDNILDAATSIFNPGSPPRAWGQSYPRPPAGRRGRFTPTGVGTICRRRATRPPSSVHPHGRGDNVNALSASRDLYGSPPRAWGQSPICQVLTCFRRFTPTGVGTMRSRAPSLGIPTVHPHGRGDNQSSTRLRIAIYGSPPRAWGQCRWPMQTISIARFTPTGVGTICIRSERGSDTTVHPHGRGDNQSSTRLRTVTCGSPPRAWGQCSLVRSASIPLRFTPTGVGTIAGTWRLYARNAVHPHGRGDNATARRVLWCVGGSPPRAWGQ